MNQPKTHKKNKALTRVEQENTHCESSEAVHLSSHALIVGNVSTTFFPIPNSTCWHKKRHTWIWDFLTKRLREKKTGDVEYLLGSRRELVQIERTKGGLGVAGCASSSRRVWNTLSWWVQRQSGFLSWFLSLPVSSTRLSKIQIFNSLVLSKPHCCQFFSWHFLATKTPVAKALDRSYG